MATESATPNLDKASRWRQEIDSARKWLEKWRKDGDAVVQRFLDERDEKLEGRGSKDTCLPLFTSNVQTQMAMMYGQTPRVGVSRRFSDAQDDVARVAGVIGERMLNTDIQRADDTYASSLWNALEDHELPGLGMVWLRYVVETEPTPAVPAQKDELGNVIAEEIPAGERKTKECVETDYGHWRDQLWSPCRTHDELRWWARKNQMTREELEKRFPTVGSQVPLNSIKPREEAQGKAADPWDRADVWEIWSKQDRRVYWYCEGYPTLLDEKEDPLGLDGFFPFPPPMMANTTTTAYIPKPKFKISQDLHNSINRLSTRIDLLIEAVKVAGLYNRENTEVPKLLTGGQNILVPCDNWAMFAESGGVKGQIDWLPLDQVVGALAVLRDNRKEAIELLYQVEGMSDIMRGQATSAGETATASRAKVNFGSVRMQRLQNEFARFASDAQRIKFEIISKHFDPATIKAASNIERTPDAKYADQAIELIKSQAHEYRVEVKPEAIALTDFAAQKQDAADFIGGVATYLQAAMPLGQAMPGAMPYLLRILQWSVSKFRGAAEIEGVLDEAIEKAEQAAQQPQQQAPDPKVIALQMKGAQDMAKIDKELQADLVRTQAETMAEESKQKSQAEWNHREKVAEASIPKPPTMDGGAKR